MNWQQTQVRLTPKPQGLHLVTDEIVSQIPALRNTRIGMVNLFLQHTSAALTLNENADPSVREDMHAWLSANVADDTPYFTHTYEGPDDMPAHIKSSLFGVSLTLPISDGRLGLGTWQGIYLCEFRVRAGSRTLLATIQGQE